ncbi:H-NS histone family protein (plasmid) [Caballeronia sp. SBC1]|uniref:H-NS family nucleoid-associated regulatory protein n=1 Tax=unclassified Caballeronia TaxID=2646786 RepID=UPI0013E16617|nr:MULTISPECIES: H-NS family nucleoid-associated regulatory protein [unclassified Caballeronia]QIE30171.1 H-NS histone family protein [Caballeronia sp. SBC2]QIN67526.1 H-NS histone family protein [Caballeronia sp. SBC1]
MPTLEQIQEKMKKLQAQADTLIAKKAQAAVDQIRKIMLTHGLTTVDIEAKAKAKREAKAANGNTPNVQAKVARSLKSNTAPKYQHPKTGATWTGHGRAPAWIVDAKDRAKFLIASGTDTGRAASVSPVNPVSKAKTAAKKASAAAGALASKGQRKGPQPAKYLDPKTGATWSGRGPAPAWLAAAKDRTRFLVDGADVGSADSGSAKHASKKTSAKKVAKKAEATKPAARKRATAKTVSR